MRNRLLSILLVLFSGGLFSQQAFGSMLERGFTSFRLSIQAKPEIIVRARYNLVRTAIVVRQAGVDSLFYVYTDHQGSILQLNDETGKLVEQRVYDPWGRARDPKNWNNYLTDLGYRRTDRGYMMHEHLTAFGLISMNGRVYDPITMMFLSPDPYVQSPEDWLNFNRYAYCLNNPLKYTDPSGEFFFIIPFIGFSPNGGLSFGVTIGLGIPNLLSAQLSFGYSTGNKDFSATVGASFAGASVYAGYSSTGGGIFGVNYSIGNLGNIGGFDISSNTLSAGINYSTKWGWSANASGIQYSEHGGWSTDPSIGISRTWGKGVFSISESSDDIDVTTKKNALITTNKQLDELLESKGVDYARDYYASLVSVENQISDKIENSSYVYNHYRRIDGIIYKLKNGRVDKPVGAITASVLNGWNRPSSYIYISTHETVPQLMLSLNHEFIHSWQWATFGYKNVDEWDKFKEASAYRYTQQYYPSITAPSYSGIWSPMLYTWPKLPFIY